MRIVAWLLATGSPPYFFRPLSSHPASSRTHFCRRHSPRTQSRPAKAGLLRQPPGRDAPVLLRQSPQHARQRSVDDPGRCPRRRRSDPLSEQRAAAVITGAFSRIVSGGGRPLPRSGQWRDGPMGAATAAILANASTAMSPARMAGLKISPAVSAAPARS